MYFVKLDFESDEKEFDLRGDNSKKVYLFIYLFICLFVCLSDMTQIK